MYIKKTLPLMEIYREDKSAESSAFVVADSHLNGNRRNMLSTLPIYTATNEFLLSFLDKRSIPVDEKQKVLDPTSLCRKQILDILKNNFVDDEIPCITEE